jgi:S1-C subfamily serine protease
MGRALLLAVVLAAFPVAAPAQAPGILRLKITLTNAAGTPVPVARHALLISDNPPTTSPRRVVTAADGTVDVRLTAGNYTVESDEPLAFGGKGYQWTQDVQIGAGREVTLTLSAANAEIGVAPAASSAAADDDPSLLLAQWKDSVVAVWTPEARASGFIVDTAGLVVTSQRLVGAATVVDVQLSASVKVAARVLVADRGHDVAVLWIDPATAGSVRPIPLNCAAAANTPAADRARLVAIGAPLRGEKEMSSGDVVRGTPPSSVADFRLSPGSLGGPVFTVSGSLVGLSSLVDEDDRGRRRDARIVPASDACAAVKTAQKAMQTAPRPVATPLPVEPLQPFSAESLEAAAKRGGGNQSAYQMSSSNFDIVFLTPPFIHAQQGNTMQAHGRTATDFGDWSDYFADAPAVLTVRVTPKLAESFWTTVARGAAYTQGVALPPIKHFKPGFSRLRALCGDAEVLPIHPFILEQRLSDSDAIREGLYVFDPQALGPQCKSVKLVLSSEKEPGKQDVRTVDPQLIERIAQDFGSALPK